MRKAVINNNGTIERKIEKTEKERVRGEVGIRADKGTKSQRKSYEARGSDSTVIEADNVLGFFPLSVDCMAGLS